MVHIKTIERVKSNDDGDGGAKRILPEDDCWFEVPTRFENGNRKYDDPDKMPPRMYCMFFYISILALLSGGCCLWTAINLVQIRYDAYEHAANNETMKLEIFLSITRTYGRYFSQHEEAIKKAIQDEHLRKNVSSIVYPPSKTPILWRAGFDEEELLGMVKRVQKFLNEHVAKMQACIDNIVVKSSSLNSSSSSNLFVNATNKGRMHIVNYNQHVKLSVDKKFSLYYNVFEGAEFVSLSKKSIISVVTQTSLGRLYGFVQSFAFWNGPISVSVLLHGLDEFLVFKSYLLYATRCHKDLLARTRFSIATPIHSSPLDPASTVEGGHFENASCYEKQDTLKEDFNRKLIKSNEWLKSELYPQNMMRNLARLNALTEYQITLDIDIMPCPKMYEGLQAFLSSRTNKTRLNALVVPTYEVSEKVNFPRNKNELIMYARTGKAQPFHKDIYVLTQNATNFPKWEKAHDSFESVHVMHTVKTFQLHYEPFFVEHHSSPLYDEGFVGYGFTRSSHAFEVAKLFGDFEILSPIYTVQLGIRKIKEWSEDRQRQNERNRIRFEEFVKNFNGSKTLSN